MVSLISSAEFVEGTIFISHEDRISVKGDSYRAGCHSGFNIRVVINIGDLSSNFCFNELAITLDLDVRVIILFHLTTGKIYVTKSPWGSATVATSVVNGTVDHLLLRERNLAAIFDCVSSFNS